MTKDELRNREIKLLLIPISFVLFASLLFMIGLPFGFYILIRFVLFFILSYLAWQHHLHGNSDSVWLLGGIAVLFNPFFPFALGGVIWVLVDVITAVVLFRRRTHLIRERS